jgi:GTPase
LLFMVPADSNDIGEEYNILLNELGQFNPELLDKQRILAISKCDMLDEELMEDVRPDLPDVPYIFLSSVSGLGVLELKDLIWTVLNDEANRAPATLTHTARTIYASAAVEEDPDLITEEKTTLFGREAFEKEEDFSEFDEED